MPDQPITRDLIADIIPDDDTVVFTVGEPPAGTWGKFTIAALKAIFTYLEDITVEYFTPTSGTSTVTLASTPTQIIGVLRNGLLASTTEWSNGGTATITFTDAFNASTGGTGGETVQVIYV